MFRRIARPTTSAAGVGLVLGALLMSGCSASPGAEASSEIETDPTKIEGTITFATWWSYADQKLIESFSEKYPNVTVNLDFTAVDSYPTKIQALASSGDLPDVFAAQAASLTGTANAGKLLDLTNALDTAPYDGEADSWGDSFVPALLSGANAGLDGSDENVWGVPFNAISVASIYNVDAFNDAGVTPPTSFDELLENCRALSDAGYIPMSLTGSVWADWWPRLAWDQTMNGEEVADFTVDDPNYVKGLEIVKQMADADCWSETQITTDIAAETSLFLQGKTAQFVSVPENFLQTVAEDAEFELGTYALPGLADAEPNRIVGGGNANVIVVSKDSPNLSAAVAFAKFLTSQGVQEELASTQFTIPSIDIDVASANPLMTAYLEAASRGFIDSATYMPALTPAGTTSFAQEVLPSLILGKLSPEEAAAETEGFYQK